jgi:hypothetical protein
MGASASVLGAIKAKTCAQGSNPASPRNPKTSVRQAASETAEPTIQRNKCTLAGSNPYLYIAFGGGEDMAALLQAAIGKGIEILEVKFPEI